VTTAQKITLRIAVILILIVNAWYATGLRFVANSPQHAVEPSYASAYVPDNNSQLAVPVQRIDGTSIRNTGAEVLFYIRSDYCGISEYTCSRLTLLIVSVGGLIFWIAGKRSATSARS
jgi:hypothetical protein